MFFRFLGENLTELIKCNLIKIEEFFYGKDSGVSKTAQQFSFCQIFVPLRLPFPEMVSSKDLKLCRLSLSAGQLSPAQFTHFSLYMIYIELQVKMLLRLIFFKPRFIPYVLYSLALIFMN